MNTRDVATLGALYNATRKTLRDAGGDTPDLDARLLISYALGCAPEDVVLKPDTPMVSNTVLDAAIARRLNHEPVSKIIGIRAFYGLDFEVNADVLDPRADTETLIDAARTYLDSCGAGAPRILDLCTGSGCLLTTLLTLFPNANGVAADISDPALAVAERNLRRHGVDMRARLVHADLLEGIEGPFDLVVCNPPYIETHVIALLDADVRLHDPLLALDGGADGLTPYKIVFPQIRHILLPGGLALFEIGAGQHADIEALAVACGLQVVAVHVDLGGHARVVALR